MKPAVAIVTPNILMGLGLKTILEKFLPMSEISVFHSFAEFEAADVDSYVHYFVSVQLFLHHSAFFRERRQKTILLGSGQKEQFAEMHQLNVFTSEEKLVRDILRLQQSVQRPEHGIAARSAPPDTLSAREAEVLGLIARGLMNKEIADRLNIGTTTVITHRRSIMEKLGIKTVAGLTIYAVTLGYIDADSL